MLGKPVSKAALVKRAFLVAISVAFIACRSHPVDVTPAMLQSVRADVRFVDGETTFVTRGDGYELAGRTKTDLAFVQPMLDRDMAVMRRVFGDSTVPVTVAIRRVGLDGTPLMLAAP